MASLTKTISDTINKTIQSATAFIESDIVKNVENLKNAYDNLNENTNIATTDSLGINNDNNNIIVNDIFKDLPSDFKVTERPQFIEEDKTKTNQYIDAFINNNDDDKDSLSAIDTIINFKPS